MPGTQTVDDLIDGIKRRIALGISTTDDTSAEWHRDHLLGMQRFVIEWERRNPGGSTVAHTDHPLQHFDRTCPACAAENSMSDSPDDITLWLTERAENCQRIAKQKTGADRAGWLEDARHFEATIQALRIPVAQPAAASPSPPKHKGENPYDLDSGRKGSKA